MDELVLVSDAVIDADPPAVYAAMEDLIRGKAQWWPGVEIRPREGVGSDLVGGVVDVIYRRIPGANTTLRIAEVRADELVRQEYMGGPAVGVGTFTLSPADGKTQLSYRWHVRPQAFQMRLIARLGLIPRIHHRMMRAYFDGLRRYLTSATS